MTGLPLALITTATRTEYRRDLLTSLAAPEGQRASFTYRARWFADGLLDPAQIEQRPAYLVFADASRLSERAGRHDFIAFRQILLTGLRPGDVLGRPGAWTPNTYFAIDFSLGAFLPLAPSKLDEHIATWSHVVDEHHQEPRPHDRDTHRDPHFVLALERVPPTPLGMDVGVETSWRTLVEHLADRPSLTGSYFFRVRELRARDQLKPLKATGPEREERFGLTTKSEYRLDLDSYAKDATRPFGDAIEAVATSDRLAVENPRTVPLGTGEDATIDLTAGAVTTTVSTTLILRPKDETLAGKAPRLELAMRITPDYRQVLLFAVLIAVGAALSGMSKTDLGASAPVAYACKLVGGLLVGGALFGAARGAPGVSK